MKTRGTVYIAQTTAAINEINIQRRKINIKNRIAHSSLHRHSSGKPTILSVFTITDIQCIVMCASFQFGLRPYSAETSL